MDRRRTLLTALAAAAGALVVPGGAHAASATVTGDDGSRLPLAARTTIRNLSPEVALAFDAAERRYSVAVTGPGGTPAASGAACESTGAATPQRVSYQGNGTYTITVRTSTDASDEACEDLGAAQVFTFDIAALTAVAAPGPRLLTRRAGESSLTTYAFRVDLNPGASGYELRYAPAAIVRPDGSLEGGAKAPVDTRTGEAAVRFTHPGTYTVVARADAPSGAASAWSTPVRVTVLSPFDFIGVPSFADARGPTYRIAGAVREPTARGRIEVTVARGARGAFHALRRVRIRTAGRFSVRFSLRRRGRYRLRYSYAGSATVAPGYVQQGIRIRRAARR